MNRNSFCLFVKWGIVNQKTIPFLFLLWFLWFQFQFQCLQNVPKISNESEFRFFRNRNRLTSSLIRIDNQSEKCVLATQSSWINFPPYFAFYFEGNSLPISGHILTEGKWGGRVISDWLTDCMQILVSKFELLKSEEGIYVFVLMMAHRIWRETKQQPDTAGARQHA